MDISEFPMVDVRKVRGLAGHRLWVKFTDGCEGVVDFNDIVMQDGSMVEPLRDQAFFERVFVEMGAPTWPNGFDVDPINLYIGLRDAGRLTTSAAAE